MPEALIFTCYVCGFPGMACPDCVITVLVDPATDMPIDVALLNGGPVTVPPSAEGLARAIKQPVCDSCVQARNVRRPEIPPWPTSKEIHRGRHL